MSRAFGTMPSQRGCRPGRRRAGRRLHTHRQRDAEFLPDRWICYRLARCRGHCPAAASRLRRPPAPRAC
eukprot:6489523-Prymnesium_polylepis.2